MGRFRKGQAKDRPTLTATDVMIAGRLRSHLIFQARSGSGALIYLKPQLAYRWNVLNNQRRLDELDWQRLDSREACNEKGLGCNYRVPVFDACFGRRILYRA